MSRTMGAAGTGAAAAPRGVRDDAGATPAHAARATRRWPWRVGPIAWFVLLAVVLTWPLVLSPFSRLGALEGAGDPYLNLWILGWDLGSISRSPLSLIDGRIFDANIFHPARQTLTYSDHFILQAIALWPLYALTGSVVLCYNVLLLGSLVAAALAMDAFMRGVTGSRWAGVMAGTIWGFWPYHFAHLGHIQLQALYFLPLAALCLHRLVAGRTRRHALLFGLFAGLQAAASVYYGVMGSLGLAVGAVALVIGVGGRHAGKLIRRGLLSAAVALLLIAPVTWPYLQSQGREGFGRNLYEAARHAATAGSYVSAPAVNLLYGRTGLLTTEAGAESELFPGFLVIALAAWGLRSARRQGSWPLALSAISIAVTGFVLSLGPDGVRPLYALLQRVVFGFHAIRAPARFAVLVVFGLAVLASLGLRDLLQRMRPVDASGHWDGDASVSVGAGAAAVAAVGVGVGADVDTALDGAGAGDARGEASSVAAVSASPHAPRTAHAETYASPHTDTRAGTHGSTPVEAGTNASRHANSNAGTARIRQLALPVAVIAVIALEYANAPLAWVPAPVIETAATRWLASAPRGAVAYLPLTIDIANTPFMVESLGHRLPIANGYSGQRPPFYGTLVDALHDFPSAEAMFALKDFEIRYVVSDREVQNLERGDWPLVLRARLDAQPPIGAAPAEPARFIYEFVWTPEAEARLGEPAVPEPPPPGTPPFDVGESLIYAVTWNGPTGRVSAGEVELSVLAPGDTSGAGASASLASAASARAVDAPAADTRAAGGADASAAGASASGVSTPGAPAGTTPPVDLAYRFRVRAKTADWISKFFEADDLFETLVSRGLMPVTHERRLREGRRRVDQVQVYNPADGVVRLADDPGRPPLRVWRASRDPIAAFYYLRTLNLQPGQTLQIPINDNGRNLILDLRAERVERIRVADREVDALRLTPILRQRVQRRQPPALTVWLSRDGRQLPLAAEVSAGFGDVRLDLTTASAPPR